MSVVIAALTAPATAGAYATSGTPVDITQALTDWLAGTDTPAEAGEVAGVETWLAARSGQATGYDRAWLAGQNARDAAYFAQTAYQHDPAQYESDLFGQQVDANAQPTTAATDYAGNATANGGEAALADTAAADATVATAADATSAAVGLAPAAATTAAAIGTLPLAGAVAGTFAVGYGIGTVIRGWLFGGDPGAQLPVASLGPVSSAQWTWEPGGTTSLGSPLYPGPGLAAPTGGEWIYTYSQGSHTNWQGAVDAGSSAAAICGGTALMPTGVGGGVVTHFTESTYCVEGTPASLETITPATAQRGHAHLGTPSAIVAAPTPPSATTVVNNTKTTLAATPALKQWINAQLGVAGTTPGAGPALAVIPQPTPWELATQYANDLATAGYTNVVVTTAAEEATNAAVGPAEVAAVSPAAGTTATAATAIRVLANPADAPYPSTDPRGGNTGGGAAFTPPTLPGITLPSIPTPCNVFPFGVPCWLVHQLGALTTTAAPPAFTIGLPWGLHLTVDIGNIFGANFGDVTAITNPVLLFFAAIGIMLWLSGYAMGGTHSSGGGGEE